MFHYDHTSLKISKLSSASDNRKVKRKEERKAIHICKGGYASYLIFEDQRTGLENIELEILTKSECQKKKYFSHWNELVILSWEFKKEWKDNHSAQHKAESQMGMIWISRRHYLTLLTCRKVCSPNLFYNFSQNWSPPQLHHPPNGSLHHTTWTSNWGGRGEQKAGRVINVQRCNILHWWVGRKQFVEIYQPHQQGGIPVQWGVITCFRWWGPNEQW